MEQSNKILYPDATPHKTWFAKRKKIKKRSYVIEIFKTNVQEKKQAMQLIKMLNLRYFNYKINFDLEDCDKILRIKGANIAPKQIVKFMQEQGFDCKILK